MTLITFVFAIWRTTKTRLDKCLKSPVWGDYSTSNIVKVPKHCWNLHRITFIIIRWSLPSQLSWKTSLLLTCKVLGLLVNTLAGDEKYPVLDRDNLTIPVQMQLSMKKNLFSVFLLVFWSLAEILNVLKKKLTLIAFVFSKFQTRKTYENKCLRTPLSEDPSTINMVNVPKHRWYLHHITFIIFIVTAKSIELEKVPLIDMKTLYTAC